MTVRISIDCMGGYHGPPVTVPASVAFVNQHDAQLLLVGREEVIRAELRKLGAEHHPQLSIVNATEVVEMDDTLEIALRRKRDSSMRVAIDQVKEGTAQACVSAGNTGASWLCRATS